MCPWMASKLMICVIMQVSQPAVASTAGIDLEGNMDMRSLRLATPHSGEIYQKICSSGEIMKILFSVTGSI